MNLGERIIAARKDLGWSRRRLASESGVPYPTLAGLESSDQKTSTATPVLAAALNVNAVWLATGKGPQRDVGVKISNGDVGRPSHIQTFDPAILSRALLWLEFEDKARGTPAQPLRRAERLIALYQAVEADDGELTPEHAQELIEAARRNGKQGAGSHGVKRASNE